MVANGPAQPHMGPGDFWITSRCKQYTRREQDVRWTSKRGHLSVVSNKNSLFDHVHVLAKTQRPILLICWIVWRLIGIVLMTVLYFLMMVFSYSMRYRFNCVMFNFSIGSFLRNVGIWGGSTYPGCPYTHIHVHSPAYPYKKCISICPAGRLPLRGMYSLELLI